MKKDKLFYGFNFDILTKALVLLASGLLALAFSGKKNKKSRKKKGFVAKTKSVNNKLNGLINAVFLNDLKKNINPDDYPIKVETAEIIEI